MTEVLAVSDRHTNADLILDCVRLGYLRADWVTLDPTYGVGTFWKKWRPEHLIAMDLDPAKGPDGVADFTRLPFADRSIDVVVLDPPYKLNGTPTEEIDGRYGVNKVATWRERMLLIRQGISEGARVLGDGFLLLKCQDQVCSGKVRWQTLEFTEQARRCGLGLVDRFDMVGHRPQPEGRRQIHARRNASSLLVFKRGWQS